MENKKKVAIYIRVSSDEQKKSGMSIDAQEEKLKEFCNFKNFEIYKIYKDEGISGGSIKKRKAFMQMISDSKEGSFSAVIVTKIDRAFRNVIDALLVLENLRLSNTDFVSVAEDIDTTTPMGKAMFTIISVFAQLEREMVIGRVRDVRQHKFNKGIFPAKSPFGYKAIYKNKKIVGFKIDEKQAEVVRDCFKMTIDGNSYKEISSKHKLKPQQFYNIIRNNAYCGYVEFQNQVKKGTHQKIISEDEFKLANNKLNGK